MKSLIENARMTLIFSIVVFSFVLLFASLILDKAVSEGQLVLRKVKIF